MPDERDRPDENRLGLDLPGSRRDRRARPGWLASKLTLAAAAVFLALGGAAAQQYTGVGVPTPNVVVSPTGPLSFTPAKVLNPKDPPFNALCDGSTDDTTALTAWAAAFTSGVHGVVPGTCVFKSPISFPSGLSNVIVDGGGTLLYAGSTNTGNLITFGSVVASGCSMLNWTLRDLTFRSSTVMVSGWGVTIIDNCVGSINNVTVGGANAGAPNVNFQYGIWMEGGNGVNLVNGNVFTAESNAEMVSGDTYLGTPRTFIGLSQYQTTILGSLLGLDIGGGMGGFYLDSSDILENGENIKISQDGTAMANAQIYFGALAATDVTTPTYIARTFNGYISGTSLVVTTTPTYPLQLGMAVINTTGGFNQIANNPLITACPAGGCGVTGAYTLSTNAGTYGSSGSPVALQAQLNGIGIEVADPGSSLSTLTIGGWVASAYAQCLKIDSTAANWFIDLKSPKIANCNAYQAGPAIDNESTAGGVFISILAPVFQNCCNAGGSAIYNVSGANPITVQGASFQDWNSAPYFTGGGPVNATFSDRGLNLFSQANANNFLQAGPSHYAIACAGVTSSQAGLWIGNGVVIPGLCDGTVGDAYGVSIGSRTFPFNYVYAVNLQTIGVTISALPTCNSGSAGLRAHVTNGQSSPTFLGTVSTTGSVVAPVFCNGSAWVYGG